MTAMWTASRADSAARFWTISAGAQDVRLFNREYVVDDVQGRLQLRVQWPPVVRSRCSDGGFPEALPRRSPTAVRRRSDARVVTVLPSCADGPHRPGTSEYWNRRKSTVIAPLDFAQHLIDVGRWKRVLRAASNRLQLHFRVVDGLARAGFSQRSADPLADGQAFPPRQDPDVRHFLIGQQHLKAFTHAMSISY